MKIPLKNKTGLIVDYAIIDDEDFEKIDHISWSVTGGIYRYAFGNVKMNGKWKGVRMHRIILGAKPDQLIDHINGIGLDNRKSNLRFCTKAENGQNSKKPKNNKSGYKGVTYYKRYEQYNTPWMAQIGFNNKHKTIGYFPTAIEAARAYDEVAKSLYKDYALLNF